MPPMNRSEGRNVHFFDASRPDRALGGLIITESTSVTNAVFHTMLEILIIAAEPYNVLLRESGEIILRTSDPLKKGNYDIQSQGNIRLNDEPVLIRGLSRTVTGRDERFRDEVRSRDGGCVVTHAINRSADRNRWDGFHVAHIFPLAFESDFIAQDFSRWITHREEEETGINSVQNGILLSAHIHHLFDNYTLSVDPDHDDLIIFFDLDNFSVEGNRLNPVCRQPGDDRAVPAQLLRWHFRQAVLTNMRGLGEPVQEYDFPPGTDMLGEIRDGPRAAERMEFELFSRLALC